ncbi:predicted GPI-anchored protein 58 [Strongylocentrotus purpuratus]|uniref:cAMP-regulated phosphoprotein 19 n=1 Tax=Strongylocentrotus purpuratus TaxID=7668 RepID=A0A7M7RHE4_STRPU|nr:predicted GPI-anchored protein 58 [Strongylocentrotus purpuratus]|eukprot:XP_795888.1 PREDICTED: predicted GPI-anchored protein 58 [Strongylocentrotus purpuratus]
MSSAEETQSTPAEAPATEVQAPAEIEESMDTSPVPVPVPATAETTEESTPDPAPAQTSEKPPAVETKAQPAVTEPSQTIPKTDSGKFIRPAKPLIKPPVPKTIQTDRPSKQSIEQMEEAKLKAKFGGLSKPGGSQFLQKRLNKNQMKYFDSGDYNMAKQQSKHKMRPLSGKPGGGIPPAPKPTGEAIPTPDSIHHRKQSSEISKLAV